MGIVKKLGTTLKGDNILALVMGHQMFNNIYVIEERNSYMEIYNKKTKNISAIYMIENDDVTNNVLIELLNPY